MSEAPKTIKNKIFDLLILVASIFILYAAYMVFTNKAPKTLNFIYSYYYVFALVGIIGFLGEKLALAIFSFLLPFALIGITFAIKFKPKVFPIEDWWETYTALAFVSAFFLIYIFLRYDRIRSEAGNPKELKTRVDPLAAAKYREDRQKQEEVNSPVGSLKDKLEKPLNKSPEATEANKKAIDPSETVEERAEREIRQIREEFSKKSTKLTTTMIRIKGLTKSLDRDQIFDNVIKTVSKGLDAPRVQLLLNDEKEGKFRIVQATGMDAEEFKKIEIPYEEKSMITHLLSTKINDITGGAGALGIKECEMDPKTKGLIEQGTIKTILAAPIYFDQKLFAILNVEEMENPDYTRDDQNLLTTCAEVAGLVMKNAKLYSATMDDLVSAKKLSEDQLKANEELKSSLTRIVSPSVAEMIMSDPTALKLGGDKCEVTVFFSDIRGFTKMSENMDPTDIVEQLNVYFTRMTDILMELSGTLDKYVGDELMALFGAPVSREDDPIRAVLCGIRMLEALYELQEIWKQENKPIIQIGIGINTGIVTAGYMGSEKQLSYTVIGDNVNLAARVMANAKGMELFITRSTYERVKDYFIIEERESIMVKGKSMPIEIFQVIGVNPEIDFGEMLSLSEIHAPKSFVHPKAEVKEPKEVYIPPGLSKEDMVQNIKIDKIKPIKCQKCGTENEAQEKFCTKCGMPIF
ncbi:MAG: adenylate/guanylate cyclase domain-containing protein [Candidatus Riflebacteria bacterium]|nr:adenylate/guanylate cyclase domain-containing protein [Candidatus Riflebacteria bacterium]